MRAGLTIAIGAVVGAAVAVIAIAIAKLLPDTARKAWGEGLARIAHPVALLIAAISRQRLEAELAILIHLVAIIVTFMVAGGFLGWLIG
jgi:hypothetical protein